MALFSGLGTDVHFSGDETGLQWEDYLFELQNAECSLTMEQDGYCKETSKNARTEQLVLKLSTACWRRLLLAVRRSL